MLHNDKNTNPKTAKPSTTMGEAFERAAPLNAGQNAGIPIGNLPPQQQQAFASAAPTGGFGAAFSFLDMGENIDRSLSQNPASEVLNKLHKALEKVISENSRDVFETKLIPVDVTENRNIGASLIIVAQRHLKKKMGVAHHTLILEGSIEPPQSKIEVLPGGQQLEIVRVVGDAYGDAMINEINNIVRNAFPNETLFIDTMAEVVPREFDPTNELAVYKLASQATYANAQEMQVRREDFQDLNLGVMPKDSTLQLRAAFNNPPTENVVGQPVRADIMIELTAAPLNTNNQSVQLVERTVSVARVGGFLDLIYDPATPMQPQAFNMYNAYQPQPVAAPPQIYSVRFVSTILEARKLLTVPAQLLALMLSFSLGENNAWVQQFRTRDYSEQDGIDMRDIGAMAIEARAPDGTVLGKAFDTKANSVNDEQLMRFIASMVHPGIVVSLDVPEVGPETWYNAPFAAAAEGVAGANQEIINAANVLTNGEFGRYYEGGWVAVSENNRIHTGYWTDKKGNRRDLREIDYLALLNLIGEKDPGVVREWSDTFARSNEPLVPRLAKRKRIITSVVPSAVITGFARRVTFEAKFVDALIKGIQAVGLSIRPTNQFQDMNSYERATGAFVSQTRIAPNPTNIFKHGGMNPNQNVMGGTRVFNTGRW